MSKATPLLIAGLLFFSCTHLLRAQGSDCDLALTHAESEFSAGHFYSIPSILGRCPEEGLSKENTVRAYLLLCQAYLILDNPIAADDSYLKLLKVDPEYVATEDKDPIDVVYLSKKFTATPIFTPHFRLGFNTSIYRSIYSVSTEPYGLQPQNTLRLGFQGGAGLDWNIDDNFSLGAEINFATRGYKRTRTDVFSAGDRSEVTSSQNWIDAPLYIKYSYDKGNIRPFGYAGVALSYLIAADNLMVFTDLKTTGSQLLAEGPSESVTYQRNQWNKSFVIGGGIKYKWGKDFLYVDLRYMGGLSNMANESTMYYQDPSRVNSAQLGNPNYYMAGNLTKYRYVTDLFRLDNVSLSFGFIRPIYDPRKVKKARTKSLSRKIEREERRKAK
ncbi:MAG TPA: porin family protein [Cyclobacteriaceae bacterium]|nr:porin family protein [Cyclobacteriaceae bacterium]